MSKEKRVVKLRPEIQRFAEEMEKQLKANEHKGHWGDCGFLFLINELGKNNNNLFDALMRNDKERITRRCANIANFAMMIADNFGGGGE